MIIQADDYGPHWLHQSPEAALAAFRDLYRTDPRNDLELRLFAKRGFRFSIPPAGPSDPARRRISPRLAHRASMRQEDCEKGEPAQLLIFCPVHGTIHPQPRDCGA